MQRPTIQWAIFTAILTGAAALAAGPERGDLDQGREKKGAALPECPVMGEEVDFSLSVSTDDGPVYFCCPRCIGKFEKDPGKFAKFVTAQHKALADLPKVQVACPLSGRPIDPEAFVQVDGQKVYACCTRCTAKYEKTPEKFAAGLAAGYTYQTKCPVSGKAIDPAAFTTLKSGFNVYFCCDGCKDKFAKEPGKYKASLESQNIFAALKD